MRAFFTLRGCDQMDVRHTKKNRYLRPEIGDHDFAARRFSEYHVRQHDGALLDLLNLQQESSLKYANLRNF